MMYIDDLFKSIARNDYSLKTDIIENKEEYQITVEVPGVKKECIDISLLNDVLTVSVNDDSKFEGEYLIKERASKKFKRNYYLENINEESIKANLEDGLLKISISKLEPKATHISIM